MRSTTPTSKVSSPSPAFTAPRNTTPTNRYPSQAVAEEKASTRLARPSSKRIFIETKELNAEKLLSDVRTVNDMYEETKASIRTLSTTTTTIETAATTTTTTTTIPETKLAEAKSVEDKTTPIVVAVPLTEEKEDHSSNTTVIATPIELNNSTEYFSTFFTTLAGKFPSKIVFESFQFDLFLP